MSIPVVQILRESFVHIWRHKLEWLKITVMPLLLFLIGTILVFLLKKPTYNYNILYFIEHSLDIIAVWSFFINGYRYGILNHNENPWWYMPLNVRFIRMMLYVFFMSLIIFGLFLFGLIPVYLTEMIFESHTVNVTLVGLLLSFAIYGSLRVFLLFPLIAIDCASPIRTSWQMMKGNVIRLFVLMLLLGFATLGISFVVIFLIMIVLWSQITTPYFMIILSCCMVALFFLTFVVFTKSLSLVYLSLKKE